MVIELLAKTKHDINCNLTCWIYDKGVATGIWGFCSQSSSAEFETCET